MNKTRKSLISLLALSVVAALFCGLLVGCGASSASNDDDSEAAVCGRSAFLHDSDVLFFGYDSYLCSAVVSDEGAVSEFTIEAGLSSDIMSVAVYNGTLFAATRDGLFAFDLEDFNSGDTASSTKLFDKQLSKGFEIYDGYVYFLYGGTLSRVPVSGGDVNDLHQGIADFDIYGDTLYFTTTEKGLYEMPVGGEGVCLATVDASDCYIAVDEDDYIYTKSGMDTPINCYSFDSKKYTEIGVSPTAGSYSPIFVCDDILLYAAADGQVCVADLESGQVLSPEGEQIFLVDKASSFLADEVLYTFNKSSHALTTYDFDSNKAVAYDTEEELSSMLAQVQGGSSASGSGSSESGSYGISDDWSTASGYGWSAPVPEAWKGYVGAEVSDGGKTVRFYLIDQEAKDCGGILITLIYSNEANPSYPSYDLVHTYGNGSYLYAVYPTDVQYDPSDPGQYPACADALDGFLKGMEF